MIDQMLNDFSILEQFRPHLLLVARDHMGKRLKQKLDEDDLVQQTLMDAYFNRHQFRGRSEGEIAAWLRKILLHNLIDTVQRFQTDKRDIRREVSFRDEAGGVRWSSHYQFAVDCRTPDEWTELAEQSDLLRNAVQQLPPPERHAIEQFYFQQDSLKEISGRTNCSVGAVSSRIYRGLGRLRSMFKADEDSRVIRFPTSALKQHNRCRGDSDDQQSRFHT
jgi:RNA polymerase sigma-70 factor (subfamily 1)